MSRTSCDVALQHETHQPLACQPGAATRKDTNCRTSTTGPGDGPGGAVHLRALGAVRHAAEDAGEPDGREPGGVLQKACMNA
jgi:hypothetical protein